MVRFVLQSENQVSMSGEGRSDRSCVRKCVALYLISGDGASLYQLGRELRQLVLYGRGMEAG